MDCHADTSLGHPLRCDDCTLAWSIRAEQVAAQNAKLMLTQYAAEMKPETLRWFIVEMARANTALETQIREAR